jgi:hypothetical protein
MTESSTSQEGVVESLLIVFISFVTGFVRCAQEHASEGCATRVHKAYSGELWAGDVQVFDRATMTEHIYETLSILVFEIARLLANVTVVTGAADTQKE